MNAAKPAALYALAQPRNLASDRSRWTVFICVLLIIAGLGYLEATSQQITFGSLLVIILVLGLWVLSTRMAIIIIAASLAVPAIALQNGGLVPEQAQIHVIAILLASMLMLFSVRSIEGWQQKLKASVGRLEVFTADAAHELRSPLNAMNAEIDVALQRKRSPEEYEQVLSDVSQDLKNLNAIVETLLFLARADADAISLQSEETDLDDLLEEWSVRWRRRAEDSGISLDVNTHTGIQVEADQVLLRRALDNLVDNAFSILKEKGSVSVRAQRNQEWIEIAVDDSGPGIPPEDRERVFERFARRQRTRDGHSGLGLPLVRTAMRVQGGDCLIPHDQPERRFRVVLRLPVTAN